MSSSRASVHAARDVDALIAAEWALEELFEECPIASAVPAAVAEEQDALIEAIAAANAEQERERAAERDRLVEKAYQQGLEEGRREGEIAEGMRLRTALGALQTLLADLSAAEARWTEDVEENLCALAVAVARQLIARELSSGPEVVVDLVRRALAEFPLDQPVRIRVNPLDLAAMSSAATAGTPITGSREASWHADPMVEPGGCVVEGRDRIIDGRVDQALERVFRRLTYNTA